MKKATAIISSKKVVQEKKNIFIRTFDSVKYELPILIVLLALFFPNRSDIATNDVYVLMHIFDYKIGFAPRLFIGSVMSLFTSYKSVAFMDMFMDVFCIVTLILAAAAAGRVLRKSSGSAKDAAIFLFILFLAVPYSRSILYPGAGSISLDRFLAVYALLSLIVVNKTRIKWMIPVLLFMGLATYHGFAFTFMPATVIVLIYSITGEKRTKENLALCVISFVTIAVFMAYFFLYKGIDTFKNVDELIAYAATKTDLRQAQTEFDIPQILSAFLLGGSSNFFQNYRVPVGWEWTGFRGELISDLYLSPLIAGFLYIWIKAYKNSENKAEKFIFTLCMLAPLARTPMFLFSSYYARARATVVVVQFFLILYFLYAGNQAVSQSVAKVAGFFRQYLFLLLLLVVYFAVFIKIL